MNNKHRKRKFTSSDDTLIREQPITGIGLKTLGTMLRISRETLMRRADELGVTLVINNDHDEAVDPLLERLKRVHGAWKMTGRIVARA